MGWQPNVALLHFCELRPGQARQQLITWQAHGKHHKANISQHKNMASANGIMPYFLPEAAALGWCLPPLTTLVASVMALSTSPHSLCQ
jgi:hypothetical protein